MEVSKELARFVVKTSIEKMPAEAITAAKSAFLDTLGVAFAGTQGPAAKIITRFVEKTGGEPKATVMGARFRTSSPNAALANALMAHALDYDDDIGVGYGHPSTVIIPAVLALGEELGRSGRDVVEAYVLGVEVWFKVARAMPRLHALGWHPTGVFGALGAAAAAAKLLRLDVEQTTMALGLAGSQACGVIQNLGTMTKPFHAGNAARGAIVAAKLAADGFTASGQILEGELGLPVALCGQGEVNASHMLDDLGMPFAIVSPGINVKKYPCYYSAHKAIDAILHLIERHDIKHADVAAVDCRVPPRVIKVLFYSEPSTGLEAKFSMQFFMAAALVDRKVGLNQFTDQKANDHTIKALMKKVTMGIHHDWVEGKSTASHPDVVTVTLKNGATYAQAVSIAKGHADAPLSCSELQEKYRECARLALDDKEVERVIQLVTDLDKPGDLKELMHMLQSPGSHIGSVG